MKKTLHSTALYIAILLALCRITSAQVAFDGSSTYMTYPSANISTTFSVTAWIKTDSSAWQTIIEAGAATSPYYSWRFRCKDNFNLSTYVNDAGILGFDAGAGTVTSGRWFFAALVLDYDTSQIALYGNGILLTNKSFISTGLGATDRNFNIGRQAEGNMRYFNGSLQDIRVYTNRALTALEINDIYKRPWDLAERRFNNSIIPDSSGNGHTATNYGATLHDSGAGWYAAFDGSEHDDIQAADEPFDTITNLSVAFWCEAEDLSGGNNKRFVHKNNCYSINIKQSTRHPTVFNYNAFAYIDSTTTITSARTHIALVKSPDGVTWYYNGIPDDRIETAAATANFTASTDQLVIGGDEDGTSYPYYGTLSDVQIYTETALNTDDIQLIYQGGTASNITARYRMQPAYSSGSDIALRACINDRYNQRLVRDLSGNGYTATNMGVKLTETLDGWNGRFDGISAGDCLVMPKNGTFDFGTNNFSVHAKFTPNSYITYMPIFSKSSDQHGDGYKMLIWNYSGAYRLLFKVEDGSSLIQTTYTMGTTLEPIPYDVICVREGTNGYCYVNSVTNYKHASSDYVIDINSSAYTLRMGAYSVLNNRFSGIIKSLAFYDRSLTTNDVEAIFSGTDTNAHIANWTMQPAFLNTGDELTGSARNYGSGADGTYYNGPTAAPWTIQLIPPRRVSVNISPPPADYQHYWHPSRFLDADDHAGSLNGTMYGGLTASTGGWEMGTSESAYVLLDGSISNGTSYTVSTWVKPDVAAMNANGYGGRIITDYGSISTERDFQIYYYMSGTYSASAYDSAGVLYRDFNTNYYDNVWQHVCQVVHAGETIELFVNGKSDGITETSFVPNNGNTNAAFGTRSWGAGYAQDKWHGAIDNIKFFNRALSEAEVNLLYKEGHE